MKLKYLSYLILNVIRFFRLTELYQPTYSPKKFWFWGKDISKRNCEDRIAVIKENIDFSCIGSYLDIGSQLGYFVFRIAETNKNMIAQGLEMDKYASLYSSSIVSLNDIQNVSFLNTKITPEIVVALPNYDVISFLNVFHHIVHFEGFESADKIMHEFYKKCNKYFIFETGQYDEKGYYWNESISFMGNDSLKWINEYLLKIGYVKVNLLSTISTHLSPQKRGLFLCEK